MTHEVIDPRLTLLASHLSDTALEKPKLAPTLKSGLVGLARIGLSR